jgi:hypothetical protein
MPQDRRTKKFKEDRKHRLLNREARQPFGDDQIIEKPRIHQETPDRCIWCDYPLHGIHAVCIQCHNCQSCGLLNRAGGTSFCYLCGNRVPEKKVPKEVPVFRRIRGQRGFQKQKRGRPFQRHRNRGNSDLGNVL